MFVAAVEVAILVVVVVVLRVVVVVESIGAGVVVAAGSRDAATADVVGSASCNGSVGVGVVASTDDDAAVDAGSESIGKGK